MKYCVTILLLACLTGFHTSRAEVRSSETEAIAFDFCGAPIRFEVDKSQLPALEKPSSLTSEYIRQFYQDIQKGSCQNAVAALQEYHQKYKPDDWLFYQLVRKTAQYISPKADDYTRYTLFKWYFMVKSGYDAIVSIADSRILFYIRSDENIYNVPNRKYHDKQYVCLNYHDYGSIDFGKDHFTAVELPVNGAERSFSYRIKRLPEFKPSDYQEKEISFAYYDNDYHFKVKLNPQITTLFKNYPTVDYESQLNIPLSRETYESLIPLLRKNVKRMSTKNGVDYLMRFTRYAFLFQNDTENFGTEKRLSPEQTLLYEQSDCEDRVALFFFLVKEIYNLPMIVLSYPQHVTIAVQFDKAKGKTITYNGNKYVICEPTPQKEDLPIGESLSKLRNQPFEVVYAYKPK